MYKNGMFPDYEYDKWLTKFAIFLDSYYDNHEPEWYESVLNDPLYLTEHKNIFFGQLHNVNALSDQDYIGEYLYYQCNFTRFMKIIHEPDVRFIDIFHNIFSYIIPKGSYANILVDEIVLENTRQFLRHLKIPVVE